MRAEVGGFTSRWLITGISGLTLDTATCTRVPEKWRSCVKGARCTSGGALLSCGEYLECRYLAPVEHYLVAGHQYNAPKSVWLGLEQFYEFVNRLRAELELMTSDEVELRAGNLFCHSVPRSDP